MQILHTVYLGLREDDNVEARIPECVALLNEQKGITASVPFTTAGAASPQTAAYVVVLVADSHEALHAYLHGDAHLNVWIPLIKPNLEEIVVFDHDLPTPFTGVAGSQALSLLLKLRVDAEQEASASSAAMQLSLLIAGVSNVYFAPHGGDGLGKATLIDKLEWPDKSQGVTCTCTQLTQPPHLILPLCPPSPPPFPAPAPSRLHALPHRRGHRRGRHRAAAPLGRAQELAHRTRAAGPRRHGLPSRALP